MRLPGLFFKEAVFVLHNFALKWAHFVTLWTKMADAVVILDRLHSAMVGTATVGSGMYRDPACDLAYGP